jgi:hypothetical protein
MSDGAQKGWKSEKLDDGREHGSGPSNPRPVVGTKARPRCSVKLFLSVDQKR